MLTLTQLVSLTAAYGTKTDPNYGHKIVERAGSCVTYIVRSIYDLDRDKKPYRKVLAKSRDMNTKSDPTKIMTFRFYGMHRAIMDDQCWVSCSCEFFTYNLEVALTTQGSSSVINSNGNMPIKRNPNTKPALCKHLLAAVKRIQKIKFDIPKSTFTNPNSPDEFEYHPELK